MKYALICLTGLMALGLVGLAPDTASARYHGWGWGGGPSASMSTRATAMPIAIVPIYYNRYSYEYGPRWRYHHRYWD